MISKIWLNTLILVAIATVADAVDFGGHVGYFGNDVKNADIGVNMMIPLGMIALAPNIDYTKQDNAGLWFGNADVAFRFPAGTKNGPSYWVGAGPTYGYVSNYTSGVGTLSSRAVRAQGYAPPGSGGGGSSGSGSTGGAHTAYDQFGGTERAWGWDANAGVSWGASSWRPYLVGRYNQVHDLKTAGVAVGLRFGH
jgi:hypothetical protein